MQLLFSLFSSFYVKRGSMLSFPKTSCPFLPIFCYLCYFFYLLLSFTTFSIFCCFSIFLCLFLSFLSSSIFQPSQPLLHPSSAVFPFCLREFHPAAVRLLKEVILIPECRTRANQRHIALQDIKELWQLIEGCFPEKPSDSCDEKIGIIQHMGRHIMWGQNWKVPERGLSIFGESCEIG